MDGIGTTPPRDHRVVATDLDGTLLRSDLTVSARTRAALRDARAAGMIHLAVTGRPVIDTRRLLAGLGYTGPAVCGQGAQVYDFGTDRLLLSRSLDTDLVRELVRRIAQRTGPLALAAVSAGLGTEFLVTAGFGAPYQQHRWQLVDEPDLWRAPVAKVLIRHPDHDDDTLAALADEVCGAALSVMHAGPGLVELLPGDTSKRTGLAFLAAELGFTGADTIAFGDMPNDLPMFDWAGYGVAMANGHPRLRDRADEITVSNDADGVAVVLERLPAVRAGNRKASLR
ncbi:putative hydrolase [Actinoplanes sp. SE50]|uniref:HAD family hydrolase n=1 Tax=unclassified Actinoplanes TaxID=2626549 RepID=UPI00006CA2D6|nr:MULTISPECIES: HAD family hydrolase [unclassified Actinoplanes]AEV84568.1 putative hydrolase [Actinoplanes sp. SE50/110]ATO82960.1 putative hydrolase [Actinoplanes sp. SE50]CAJ81028.1 putative hydrolase AcbJ [Actinoplanes sp. SE50/110]SLM00368.1 putative hydrolase of HAD superfamily [Actinoplanes sp. SE50/110]